MDMKKISLFLSSQYHQYLRVWKLLKKPTMTEFKTVSKVSALGLILIGAIGFLISITMNFLF